jgi:hypothetical protein
MCTYRVYVLHRHSMQEYAGYTPEDMDAGRILLVDHDRTSVTVAECSRLKARSNVDQQTYNRLANARQAWQVR